MSNFSFYTFKKSRPKSLLLVYCRFSTSKQRNSSLIERDSSRIQCCILKLIFRIFKGAISSLYKKIKIN